MLLNCKGETIVEKRPRSSVEEAAAERGGGDVRIVQEGRFDFDSSGGED